MAHEAWVSDEVPIIIVDLYGLASIADLVVRLERAYRAHAKGAFRRAVEVVVRSTQLGFSLGGAGTSTRFSERSNLDALPALHAALDLPPQVAARLGRRCVVVFDEFQAIMAVDGAEAIVRSHVQHHREKASYIFAGSESSLLDAVFADRARPFFGQAEPFRLGRLPDAPLATPSSAASRRRGAPWGCNSIRSLSSAPATRGGPCWQRTASGQRRRPVRPQTACRGPERSTTSVAAPGEIAKLCGIAWPTPIGGPCGRSPTIGPPMPRT